MYIDRGLFLFHLQFGRVRWSRNWFRRGEGAPVSLLLPGHLVAVPRAVVVVASSFGFDRRYLSAIGGYDAPG